MKSKLLVTLSLLLVLFSFQVIALSTSFGYKTYTANATINYFGQSVLSTSYKMDLDALRWTDSSTNTTGCEEYFLLSYSTDGSSYTNSSWFSSTVTTNWTGVGNTSITAGSYSLSTYSGIKAVRLYGNASINRTRTTTTCSITGVSLGYNDNAGLTRTLEGLPNIGRDTGNFFANLAPGVGIMILLIAVFGALAGLVSAIIIVISRKFGEGKE
jgi:hypothetical protein